MNTIALLIASVSALYAPHNSIRGDTPICTNITEVVAAAAPSSPTWSAPDTWEIGYEIVPQQHEYEGYALSTNAHFQVLSNYCAVSSLTLAAKCSAEPLDIYSQSAVSVTNWVCLTQGGSFSNNILSASADGTYSVIAYGSDGARNTTDIPLTSYTRYAYSNGVYVADAAIGRTLANSNALAILNAATPSGDEFKWNTFRYRMCGTHKNGNSCPFAISPHILVSAEHWHWWDKSPKTFVDDNGNSNTVTIVQDFCLKDWAEQHYTNSLEGVSLEDIHILVCSNNAAVPDGCIPYLMSEPTRQRLFGGDFYAVNGWSAITLNPYAMPLVFDNTYEDGKIYWGFTSGDTTWVYGGTYGFDTARADIYNRLSEMGLFSFWPARGSASGKPIFITYQGKIVVVSHFWYSTGGPDYCRAFEVFKALIKSIEGENYNLKEIE